MPNFIVDIISNVILLHEKLLQFDWLRAMVLHVKITNLLRVEVVNK